VESGQRKSPTIGRHNSRNAAHGIRWLEIYRKHAGATIDVHMDSVDDWFVATILPHEEALVRYLHRMWRNRAEIPDICQEVYVRIYEGAARSRPESPKSFLFTTARNLLADKARRERVVSINYTQDSSALDVLTDDLSPERRYGAEEELRRLSVAFDQLSDNFREVIWLRRIEGLSQKEAAQRLSINEGTLESRLNRALVALTRALAAGSAEDDVQSQDHDERTPDSGEANEQLRK
jgi:RNA polymerase sigma factor (sigma-70 family)